MHVTVALRKPEIQGLLFEPSLQAVKGLSLSSPGEARFFAPYAFDNQLV
jgi:hypothetical protein